MIKRTVRKKVNLLYKRKEILALVGARQVGKTTLMKDIYNKTQSTKKAFLTFDDIHVLTLFEHRITEFIQLYVEPNKFLFIDEFQYAKSGGKSLKYIYDKYGIKIVISGSAVAEMSIRSLQFLVGRVLIVEVFPFDFGEFLRFKNPSYFQLYNQGFSDTLIEMIKPYFYEYLTFGGFPEVVKTKNILIKKQILSALINTYLLKEIKDILQYKNIYVFEKFIKYFALKHGSILNISKVASDLQLSRYKVYDALGLLEKSYALFLLKPMKSGTIKQLIKSPKTYFMDSGFRNCLMQNYQPMNMRMDKGLIFEGFVLNQLIKIGVVPQFYNYRNNTEVDFVCEFNGKKIAFEVKSSLKHMNISKSIDYFLKKIKPDEIYILSENFSGKRKIGGAWVQFDNILNLNSIIKKSLVSEEE